MFVDSVDDYYRCCDLPSCCVTIALAISDSNSRFCYDYLIVVDVGDCSRSATHPPFGDSTGDSLMPLILRVEYGALFYDSLPPTAPDRLFHDYGYALLTPIRTDTAIWYYVI